MTPAPVFFISHGAPTFAIEPGVLGPQLQAAGQRLSSVKAVLVVSPHWQTRDVQVMTTRQPETVHDFGGFPSALYDLQYPAPGEPTLADAAARLLAAAGFSTGVDARRGLDHGAWVPLRFVYPQADVPMFQVSMPSRLDERSAYALGQALAPLRDEGVLVVGSGSLTHNLYEFRGAHGADAPYARAFSDWVRDTLQRQDHTSLLQTMALAPHAERAHPTPDHLLPLMVAAGAAGADVPVQWLDGGITHGVLSMDSFVFDPIQ